MAVVEAADELGAARAELVGVGRRGAQVPLGDAAGTEAGQITHRAGGEAVELRIEIGRREGEHQTIGRADRGVELEALHRLLTRIVQLEAGAGEQEALEALDGLVEQRKVDAEAVPLRLHADFVDFRFFRSGKARSGAEVRHSQPGISNRRGRRAEERAARARNVVAEGRTAVTREVDRACLEASGVAGVDVDFIRNLVGSTQQVGEFVILRAPRFDRVRQVEERRLELERRETDQRVDRRVGRRSKQRLLVSKRQSLELLTRAHRAAGRPGDEGIDQVDVRQLVERLLGELKVLLVVGVVEAGGENEAIDRFEVHGAEHRPGGVIHRELLGGQRAGREDRTLRQAEALLHPVEDQRVAGEQREEGARIRTGGQAAVLRDRLVEVEAAEQEVDRAIEVRCDPQFLGEGIDLLVADFADDFGAGEVDVLVLEVLELAIGGDRGDRQVADVPVGLERAAVVVDDVFRDLVEEGVVAEEIGVQLTAHGEYRSRGRAGDEGRDLTAGFVDLRVIGDRADLEIRARLDQQLATGRPAVTLGNFLVEIDDRRIAVTLVVAAVDRPGDVLADRAGQLAAQDHGVEVAVAGFDEAAEFILRLLGHDRDHTGRGVLAEQGRLRPVQHFNALDHVEVGQGSSRTRTEHAVDEHADRRLDAEVVIAVAETADDEGGRRGALQLANTQRGHHRLEIENVADLRTFDRLAAGHRHGDRHFLQGLLALGGGDDDLVAALLGLGLGVLRKGNARHRDGDGASTCQQGEAV